MKKTLKGYLIGVLSTILLVGCITAFAANTTTLYDVVANGVKIVIDGKRFIPTNAGGGVVEPIIYNGTTYLPVRAVANAFGKAVYWDGPNYTVYLGKPPIPGELPYPTEELSINDDIGDGSWIESDVLKDNLGNTYSRAIYPWLSASVISSRRYEKICNMKFSKFKGTIYVMNGSNTDGSTQFLIKADGKTVYTSPEITKSTAPIDFNIDITGCYDLQIVCTGEPDFACIGNGGFYQ